jgi:type IV pilus assembly protein PilW
MRIAMYPSPSSRGKAAEGSAPHYFVCIARPALVPKSRGFSLIELMVGIVISLIGTLAIMAAFALFEGQKRTTTAGDDAQQNGSFALYTLERQLRTAGSGLVQGNRYGLWGCAINANTSGAVVLPSGALAPPFNLWPTTTLAMPVLVSAGGALPDVIGVISGNPAGRVFKAPVSSTPDALTVVLTNSYGIFANDYLLGTLPSGACALAFASTAPNASNSITLLAASSATGGLQTATGVYDMGSAPIFSLYGIDPTTNSLVTYDLLQRPSTAGGAAPGAIPIADRIVQMKALYGIHDGTICGTADASCIDYWVQPTGTTWGIAALTANTAAATTAMGEIKAIRVAVVAQSRLPERTSDYSTGQTTLTLFRDLAATLRYSVVTLPQYRYKVYDTTIPIRNAMITRYF